jgi:predicted RNA polymerase sigma factor
VLAGLVPAEAEVHGLVALMELQASRFRARVGRHGEAVLLLDQDRSRWDRLLISRGLAALARARALDGGGGFYALQAGIAACHARAGTPDATDWPRVAALHARLVDVLPGARGDLMERPGRPDEARAEFARAAGLTRNARERAALLARARAPE